MAGISDLDTLVASMEPTVREGRFVFVTVAASRAASLPAEATVREDEGVTVVLAQDDADACGLAYDFVAGWITRQVHSALHAVGLTATFSAALADAGISANVLAGHHHDHLLVPIDDVPRALVVLGELSASRRS